MPLWPIAQLKSRSSSVLVGRESWTWSASCIWSPYLIKDINLLENVHKRATRMCPELRNMTYRVSQLSSCPWSSYFTIQKTQTRYDPSLQTFARVWPRGWGPKYAQTHYNRQDSWTQLQVSQFHSRSKHSESFSTRIIDNWIVVTAKTVNEFKSKLNDTWKYHPLKFDV